MSKIKQKIDELWELAEEAKLKENCSQKDRRVLNILQRELKKLKLEDDATIQQAAQVVKEEWQESIEQELFDNEDDENN